MTNFFLSIKNAWILFALVVIGFISTVWIQHIGEEPVYTITTLEMLQRQEWLQAYIYGGKYTRPPFYNWLIIGTLKLLGGPSQVLIAARLVSFCATLATAGLVYKVSSQLWGSRQLSWMCLFSYLTGDVLLRRGWLAYADPTFAFLIFLSMSLLFLWATSEKKSYFLVIMACIAANFAYLAKLHTAYVFYGALLLALLVDKNTRSRVLDFKFIVIHMLFILAPMIAWALLVDQGLSSSTGNLIYWLKISLLSGGFLSYGAKITYFPVQVLLLTLPISLVAILVTVRSKGRVILEALTNSWFLVCAVTFLLGVAPYWLVPHDTLPRFILPMMPWLALCYGYIINLAGARWEKLFWIFVTVTVITKLILVPFYYYQQDVRKGNARDISTKAITYSKSLGLPMYVRGSTSKELRVVGEADIKLYPDKLIMDYKKQKPSLIISGSKYDNEEILDEFRVEGEKLYILRVE